MKAWKKGAVTGTILGIVIAIAMIILSLGHYQGPFGISDKGPGLLYFWLFHLLVGGSIGVVVVLLAQSYKKHERKVSLKYPIAGFILFYLIQYVYIIILGYIEHKGRGMLFTIIGTPFFLIFYRKAMIINFVGLIFGYLVGYVINRKNTGVKKLEEN